MARDSALKPFYAALILAFVCSFLVASASVGLRARQQVNRQLERKKNILRAAGIYKKGVPIDTLFAAVDSRIINLKSGKFVSAKEINPKKFDQRLAVNNPKTSRPLSKEADIAGLSRLEDYSWVYLVKKGNKISQIILPIRGSGLWSMMYGYLALNRDLNTIRGITFYEHGETPGLGGEIENPVWQAAWRGKKIYRRGKVDFKVVKGGVKAKGRAALHRVDGITGATLTSKGVDKLLHFWFGDYGFKPFLARMRQQQNEAER
jgi:Na+-transporting NADH:ubiquinone oxidoreductase subunit C